MNLEETPQSHEKTRRRRAAAYDPTSEIVSARDLRAVVGISKITVWRLRRAGLFPQPIKLTVGRIGWRRRDLDAWLDARQQAARR